jgi:WD40 repeat protein
MVVAEIPLWVTHNMDSPETGTHPSHYKSAGSGGGNGPPGPPGASGSRAAAAASLSLLQEEKKKCAIYAVDVHPSGTKFATAGGDGTVRLWSTSTLFLNKTKGGRFQYQNSSSGSSNAKTKPPPATTTTTAAEASSAAIADAASTVPPPAAAAATAASGPIGGYVSTTASSGSSSASSSNSADGRSSNTSSNGNSNDDNAKNKQNGNRSSSSASSSSSSNGSSSSSSSVDNNSTTGAGSATETSSSFGIFMNGNSSLMADMENAAIHDLNDVVRRKKDGEPTSPTRKVVNDNKPPPPSSPWKGLNQQTTNANTTTTQQHSQHHHHQRLLCTLSAHTGSSVLAIRFSNTGNFLASAGDDGCVCLYAPTSSLSSTSSSALVLQGNLVDNGGGSSGALEHHWSRIALCRGHNLDVVGLAWAPDDSHLVSCSLDRETPIIVWKLTDLTQQPQQHETDHHQHSQHSMIRNPYRILGKNVHSSTVKGVTFDPAGSYLASSGDDPAVCIWRAHDDWGLEKRIDAKSGIFRQWKTQTTKQQNETTEMNFDDDTQALSSQSLFRRISWSTDGAFICSTNSVVRIYKKASWCFSPIATRNCRLPPPLTHIPSTNVTKQIICI